MNNKLIFLTIILILLVLAPIVLTVGNDSNNLENTEEEISMNSQSENEQNTQNNSSQEADNQAQRYESPPEMQLEDGVDYRAVINTSKGEIKVDLFEDEVPVTVNNFIFLANEDFYQGSPFHRIIEGFMIQGGDPTGTGRGGPGYRFDDEEFSGEYTAGTIAMANAGPNTNGSQFFIMHENYDLPKNYTIFGRAEDKESLNVINEIASTPVEQSASGEMSKPTEEVLVEDIQIVTE